MIFCMVSLAAFMTSSGTLTFELKISFNWPFFSVL